MSTTEKIITIAVVVLGTMITRFLPFIIFPEGKEPPKFITYLGKVLPYAIVGMLVVYCMKDAVFSSFRGLPEIISIIVIAFLHIWKKNMILSMGVGTVLYMILVQYIFV